MKPISRFVGTTILGGVLFLTPIVVLGFVLSKAFDIVRRGLKPLTALIPDTLASGPSMTTAILAIIILALLCFLAGLSARTPVAQKFVRGLEATVLSKLPGYEYLKEAGTSVLGLGEAAEHPVVRKFRRRVAHRRSDRRRQRRPRRGIHSKLPESYVGLSVFHAGRSSPPGQRAALLGHRLPQAMRRGIGRLCWRICFKRVSR